MSTHGFKFEAVTKMAWDFNSQIKHHQNEHKSGKLSVAPHAALQAAQALVDTSKPFIPNGLYRMPAEIQAMIWVEKMQKPGLHFLVVHVPLTDSPANCNESGVRKIKLTEACHKVYEVHTPYRSYFPKDMRSAYHKWSELTQTFPFARDTMKQALVKPLTIPAHNGYDVTIDAATDLLYLKFHWRPSKGPSQYVQCPAYWMLILDHTELKGIRHVAFDLNQVHDCIFWPSGPADMCGSCGEHKDEHDEDISSELWLLADFLHCLDDLESVYLVFNDVKQGPVDKRRDLRYTVSGRPDVKATETDPGRWSSSPDPIFRGDGGSVRELRGNHVILPLAHIVDALQAYYIFHCKTAIGEVEAVSKRKKTERMTVQFKMATIRRDD